MASMALKRICHAWRMGPVGWMQCRQALQPLQAPVHTGDLGCNSSGVDTHRNVLLHFTLYTFEQHHCARVSAYATSNEMIQAKSCLHPGMSSMSSYYSPFYLLLQTHYLPVRIQNA